MAIRGRGRAKGKQSTGNWVPPAPVVSYILLRASGKILLNSGGALLKR